MAMSNRDSWRLLCAVSRTKPTRHMKIIHVIKMQDAREAAYIVIEEPWDMPAMVACKRIDVGTLHVLPVQRSWVSRVPVQSTSKYYFSRWHLGVLIFSNAWECVGGFAWPSAIVETLLRIQQDKPTRHIKMQGAWEAAYIEIEEPCDMTAMVDKALKASGFTGKEKRFRELPR